MNLWDIVTGNSTLPVATGNDLFDHLTSQEGMVPEEPPLSLWRVVTDNSTLPVAPGNTFWDHLINQRNLGVYIYFQDWLADRAYQGTYSDKLKAFLEGLGFIGTVSGMLYNYLENKGYTQEDMTSKMWAWESDGFI